MFFVTRPTPRRPEVEDDRFAPQRLEINRLAAADSLQRERRCRLSDERRVDDGRVLAETGEKDEDDHRHDDDADDQDCLVHATASESISGALSGTTTYVRRRIGIKAINPPTPIIRTAPQIQPTIGMLMMSTPA